LKSEY